MICLGKKDLHEETQKAADWMIIGAYVVYNGNFKGQEGVIRGIFGSYAQLEFSSNSEKLVDVPISKKKKKITCVI